jgi:hypothetical protein
MGQAFGSIKGSDGSIDAGSSGNFSVVKNSVGLFTVTVNNPGSEDIVAVCSPADPYRTAVATPLDTYPSYFQIATGYTDQSAPMDIYYISFIAFWN